MFANAVIFNTDQETNVHKMAVHFSVRRDVFAAFLSLLAAALLLLMLLRPVPLSALILCIVDAGALFRGLGSAPHRT